MPVRYLLDTNIASYAIKGAYPQVRAKLVSAPMSAIGISAVTEAELRFGVEKQRGATRLRQAVEEFLVRVEILPWDSLAARYYAALRSHLENAGKPMGNLDMMIAAQALASGAILVTHDRVFHNAPRLKLEDWTKAS